MKTNIKNTFKEKLYECNKHKEKLQDAKEFLGEIFPLTLEKYLKIDKVTSSFIDQLNFRFSKLQDTIGESIFKMILTSVHEDIKRLTFLDILNRLEELEIIDKSSWLKLREIRNEIAHEYSFNQEEVVDNINLIYIKSDELIEIFNKVDEFIYKKINIRE